MPINWKFIQTLEGTRAKAYVPMNAAGIVIGQSGVTVGSGFDIGQWSYDGIVRLGLPLSLLKRLVPYIGLKRQAAVAKLREIPLTLSLAEVALIDSVVQRYKEALAEAEWAKGKPSTPWSKLTDTQQTVVASVLFQYGSPKRFPNFWRVVQSGDWNRAVTHLRNFGDAYKTRRFKEADILEASLKTKGKRTTNGQSI